MRTFQWIYLILFASKTVKTSFFFYIFFHWGWAGIVKNPKQAQQSGQLLWQS